MNTIDNDALYSRLKSAINSLEHERNRVQQLQAKINEPIAIIGMACYLPGGIDNVESFWQALIEQKNILTEMNDERWPSHEFVDKTELKPGKMLSEKGGFILNHDKFDATFFGISPREVAKMDPQQRLILKSNWRALEFANIAPDTIKKSNAGVFIGASNTDYGYSLLKHQKMENLDGYQITGNVLNALAGRLSYFLDIHGPSIVIDTACSSSLVALHYACQSLRQDECQLALCSGVNTIFLPEGNIALSQAGMLSKDGECFAFDERANGYVRSEGCITLLLKKVSDAKNAGDKIYGLIKGTSVNHGGKSSGLTVPNPKAQSSLIRQALKFADIAPSSVNYIEAHGTGTALGDPIEISALNEVFANTHHKDDPLYIGSVKSNFGHLESASGLLGLLKVILAMNHHVIPATKHLTTLNSFINLNEIPAKIVTENIPWNGDKIAGVSSFGFSGINAHAVISSVDDEINLKKYPEEIDSHYIVTNSAKDKAAFYQQKEQLIHFLEMNKHVNLESLAYSYNTSRNHFVFREANVVKSIEDYIAKLKLSTPTFNNAIDNKRKKIAFLFSGQGSQYHGMGKVLYQTSLRFKNLIDATCEKVNKKLNVSLQEIMFAEKDERLNQTLYTQPILFVFNYCLAKLWMSWGITADCYIGHSIGEYVAATLADVISLDDALFLICERSRLMQSLPKNGGMLLVMASKEEIEAILSKTTYKIDVAIVTHAYTVLSGDKSDLDQFEKMLSFHVKAIEASHAFHSSLMSPILDEFENVAKQIHYEVPKKEVISNLTGELYQKTTVNAEYWKNHLRHAVDLRKSMQTLVENKYDILLEVGPRPTFSKSINTLENLKWIYSLRQKMDDWQSLLMNLAELYEQGVTIHWKNFYSDCDYQKIQIPGYPFQEKSYWGLPLKQEKNYSKYFYQIDNKLDALVREHKENIGSILLISNVSDLTHLFMEQCKNVTVCHDLQSIHLIHDNYDNIIFAYQYNVSEVENDMRKLYDLFLHFIQHIISKQSPTKIWLVSFTEENHFIWQSPLIGFLKCLSLEESNLDCMHVELHDNSYHLLIDEIQQKHFDKNIILKNNSRYITRLNACQLGKKRDKVIEKNAAYLLTGGQGALAEYVLDWYVKQGASYIVLLSRSAATTKTLQLIEKYAALGSEIHLLSIDVSDKNALQQLFAEFGNTRPELHGIVHTAGVLDDGLIQHQTSNRFENLLKSKILGAWHLHELSLNHPVEHFVLFSSLTSILGVAGQSNYAAANTFLDKLALFRQSEKLPALSINWGPWSEIGMAKNIISHVEGLTKISPALGIDIFHTLMWHESPAQILVSDIDWESLKTNHPMHLSLLHDLIPAEVRFKSAAFQFDVKFLRTLQPETLKVMLCDELQIQFQKILHLDISLDLKQNFFELGMDSLMAIGLRHNLQELFKDEIHLSQTVLFELTTLNDLADYLVKTILSSTDISNSKNSLFSKEDQWLASIDALSEEDIDNLLKEAGQNE